MTESVDTGGNIRDQVNNLQNIIYILVFGLFIGFIAIFIAAVGIFNDSFTNKAATYQELTKEVRTINQKIDSLNLKK